MVAWCQTRTPKRGGGRTPLLLLADAVIRELGVRVNVVLWRTGRGDLRSTLRANGVLQKRLRSLSNAELSALAAALPLTNPSRSVSATSRTMPPWSQRTSPMSELDAGLSYLLSLAIERGWVED